MGNSERIVRKPFTTRNDTRANAFGARQFPGVLHRHGKRVPAHPTGGSRDMRASLRYTHRLPAPAPVYPRYGALRQALDKIQVTAKRKARMTRIEVFKESMKFSAAHFTIFSATERERLHGHNFTVYAMIEAPVGDNGMCFSYVELKDRLRSLCAELDEYTLLPKYSPYLSLASDGPHLNVTFDGATFALLETDTLVLPIRNSTVEEYAAYILDRLLSDSDFVVANGIVAVEIRVSSGPGQRGSARWGAE